MLMFRLISISAAVLIFSATANVSEMPSVPNDSFLPTDGYVPTSGVAKEIAYAVLVPVYGKSNIDRKLPFEAVLMGDIWKVKGTLSAPPGRVIVGGVPTVMISKKDGRILYMTHTQ